MFPFFVLSVNVRGFWHYLSRRVELVCFALNGKGGCMERNVSEGTTATSKIQVFLPHVPMLEKCGSRWILVKVRSEDGGAGRPQSWNQGLPCA